MCKGRYGIKMFNTIISVMVLLSFAKSFIPFHLFRMKSSYVQYRLDLTALGGENPNCTEFDFYVPLATVMLHKSSSAWENPLIKCSLTEEVCCRRKFRVGFKRHKHLFSGWKGSYLLLRLSEHVISALFAHGQNCGVFLFVYFKYVTHYHLQGKSKQMNYNILHSCHDLKG